MKIIMRVIVKSFDSFMYIGLLLGLFSYIFTLLGMNLIGGKWNFKVGMVRQNFDSFM